MEGPACSASLMKGQEIPFSHRTHLPYHSDRTAGRGLARGPRTGTGSAGKGEFDGRSGVQGGRVEDRNGAVRGLV